MFAGVETTVVLIRVLVGVACVGIGAGVVPIIGTVVAAVIITAEASNQDFPTQDFA